MSKRKRPKKELTVQDIKDIYEEAKQFNMPYCKCNECGKLFFTFFAEHNERYDRFINGEVLTCFDHVPTDLIVENLGRPQN